MRDRGKNAPGEKMVENEKTPKGKSLYPIKELESLELNSSDSDTGLSSSEEEVLDEVAARNEEERYHPDERRVRGLEKKLKIIGVAGQATTRLSGPNAPSPYAEIFYSDSFLTKEEQRKVQQAFLGFEGAEAGSIHAPVEFDQIKELA